MAYDDRITGENFLKFLEERLILLKELLSNNGSIYLHIDYKVGHKIKVLMDKKDFEEMRDWVTETRFDRLGCFTYSHEEKTHAHELIDDVPEEVKQERVETIMAIQQEISFGINQDKVGRTFKVLIDKKEGNYLTGRTEYDSPEVDNEVLIDTRISYASPGSFVQVKIDRAEDFDLYGQIVKI